MLPWLMEDMPYKVEQWFNGRVFCLLAVSMNQLIAAAAYDRAVECYPNDEITLRFRCRVIRTTRP